MYNRWQRRGEKEIDTSSHINDRSAKMTKLRKKARTSSQGVLYLQEKVRKLCENCGDTVDESLHSDLFTIMKENREQILLTAHTQKEALLDYSGKNNSKLQL